MEAYQWRRSNDTFCVDSFDHLDPAPTDHFREICDIGATSRDYIDLQDTDDSGFDSMDWTDINTPDGSLSWNTNNLFPELFPELSDSLSRGSVCSPLSFHSSGSPASEDTSGCRQPRSPNSPDNYPAQVSPEGSGQENSDITPEENDKSGGQSDAVYTLQDFMMNKNYPLAPTMTYPPPADGLKPLPFSNGINLNLHNSKGPNTFLGSKGGLLRSILTSSGDNFIKVKRGSLSPGTKNTNGSNSSDSGYGSKKSKSKSEDNSQSSEESRIPTLKRKAPASTSSQDSTKSKNDKNQRKRRFDRTKDALEQSGLLEITMKTADLIKSNRSLDSEVADLQRNSQEFLRSVLNNPQNQQLREFLLAKKRERESGRTEAN